MKRNKISIARTTGFFVSNNSLGTDALNAIATTACAKDLEIENETEDKVEISYVWTSSDKFCKIQEHLVKFGLRRVNC
jgi:hypothetical protein